jgi:hypothetical protein
VGVYVVQKSDLPLYQVDVDERSGRMNVKSLQAGVSCGSHNWSVL